MNKVGDHIRLTMEGTIESLVDQQLAVSIAGVQHIFGPRVQGSAGFSIEKIERPLAAGDLVRAKCGVHGSTGRLICVFDFMGVPWAAVHFVDSAPGTSPLADYVRAE